ncbi:MAG TPA: hypothetical protein VHZ99_10160 [Steroidobacteraceae bacterium]|jgi:hypothetical protein|nr:hypothetical protein [Steroidobacteraceae bacterium]
MKSDIEAQQQRLERLIGAGLAEQPPLQAPSSLQARVLSELTRRAALPWWQRSLRHWPLAMKLAFFGGALIAGRLLIGGLAWSRASQAAAQLLQPGSVLASLQSLSSACVTMGELMQRVADVVLHQVPALWLYGGIGLLLTMYVTLAGIGVTVYRSLDNA